MSENCMGEGLEAMTGRIDIPDPKGSDVWDVEYSAYLLSEEDGGVTATTAITGEVRLSGEPQIYQAILSASSAIPNHIQSLPVYQSGHTIDWQIDAATRVPVAEDGNLADSRLTLLQGLRDSLDSLGFATNEAVNGGDTVEVMDVVYGQLKPWTEGGVAPGGEPEEE